MEWLLELVAALTPEFARGQASSQQEHDKLAKTRSDRRSVRPVCVRYVIS